MKFETELPQALLDDLAAQARAQGVSAEIFAGLRLLEAVYGPFESDHSWRERIDAVMQWQSGDMGRSEALRIIGHDDVGMLILIQQVLGGTVPITEEDAAIDRVSDALFESIINNAIG